MRIFSANISCCKVVICRIFLTSISEHGIVFFVDCTMLRSIRVVARLLEQDEMESRKIVINRSVYRTEIKCNGQFFKKSHGRFLNMKVLHCIFYSVKLTLSYCT